MTTDLDEDRWDDWNDLMDELGTNHYLSEFVFQQLCYQYSTPDRHYHGLGHVSDCLKRLNEYVADNPVLVKAYVNLNALKVAIWFHDVVYSPTSKTNEIDSAAFACRWLNWCDGLIGNNITDKVDKLILLTTHKDDAPAPTDLTSQLMLDIDLASLGYSPKTFIRNGDAIRKEYAFVPEDKFNEGRVKLLQGFLNRSRIYHTDWFFSRYEKQARENIAREIAEILKKEWHPLYAV